MHYVLHGLWVLLQNLLDQLKTHMNRYFLMIAFLQLIPTITPVPPMTTWLPLGVVFAITAVKEGIDDLRRQKHDQVANQRLYKVVTSGGRERELQSQHIRVGDVVYVKVPQPRSHMCCPAVLLAVGSGCRIVDWFSDLLPRWRPCVWRRTIVKSPVI